MAKCNRKTTFIYLIFEDCKIIKNLMFLIRLEHQVLIKMSDK